MAQIRVRMQREMAIHRLRCDFGHSVARMKEPIAQRASSQMQGISHASQRTAPRPFRSSSATSLRAPSGCATGAAEHVSSTTVGVGSEPAHWASQTGPVEPPPPGRGADAT